MKHLNDTVYGILTQFNFLNSYVIKTDDGVVVVDIGLDEKHVDRLVDGLQKFGWSLDDVTHILITHSHYDHCGGLAALQRRIPNVTTYAHRLDARVIRGEQPQTYATREELSGIPRMMYGPFISNQPPLTPARIDVEVNDGDVLDQVMAGLTVVHLPGHSYGQVGFWMPEKRALLGGDVMIRTPFRLAMPVRVASPDWEEAKASIRKVGTMNVDALYLGHGTPITANAHEKIAKLVAHIDR